jgi:hypothetical protein
VTGVKPKRTRYRYRLPSQSRPSRSGFAQRRKVGTQATASTSTIGSIMKGMVGSIPILVSLAALITSTITLLFIARPELKPKEKLGASISKIEVEQGITYAQYSTEVYGQAGSLPGISEDRPGYVVYVTVNLEGFQQREYLINPRLYVAKTRQYASFFKESFGFTTGFSPAASADKIAIRAWNPRPPSGTYFVRVLLFDQGPRIEHGSGDRTARGTLLDFADSQPFVVN